MYFFEYFYRWGVYFRFREVYRFLNRYKVYKIFFIFRYDDGNIGEDVIISVVVIELW